MIEWFSQVFAANADTAFFVTVMTATLLVLMIFLVVHFINRRRLKREYMAEKVERLYAAVVEYEEKAFDAITLSFSGQDESDERFMKAVGDAHSALRRVRVISRLFFESIEADHEELMNEVLHAISSIQEAVNCGDFDAATKSMNDGFEQVSEDVKKLEEACLALMKQYGCYN